MKKIMSLFLSVALLASMLTCVTSVFAFEGYKAETSLLNGLPAQNSLAFSKGSCSAQISVEKGKTYASWQDGKVKVTSSDANGYAIADIKANYTADAIKAATDDFLELSFEVSYNGAPNQSYVFQFYNYAGTRLAEYTLNWTGTSSHLYRGGTGAMDTTGATTDVITARVDLSNGTVNGYVDGKILTNMTSKTISLTGGIGYARLWWRGASGKSINFHNLSLNTSNHVYYDHKVLMSGIKNFDGAAVNGVKYTDTNAGTVTKAADGKVTISGLKTAYTRLTFENSTPIVNGTTFPNGGKIYYEQTVSFSAIPTTFSLAFKGSGSGYESARPSLTISTDYGNGAVQCWNVGEGDRFQYIQIKPNTPYRIGVLYDLKTGEYQAYVNGKGANTCKGVWTPTGKYNDADLKFVWLEVKLPTDADTITVSDLFVMRAEPSNFNLETGAYDTNTDVLFSGISHVPGCYKWSDNGFLYQSLGSATLSKDDLCSIKATADAKDEYVRMKLDAKVNETKYPTGIAVWEWDFEIESQNATEPHHLEFNNGGKGIVVFEEDILPGKHTAEFVYNPKTGEYRYYIDGVASDVYSISKDTGIDTLYLEWRGNVAGDACVLNNVKFSNLKTYDADSIGSITVTANTATVTIHSSNDYSLIPDSLDFIIAAYDDNNQLVALHYETKKLTAVDNTLSVNLENTNGGTKIKAFLWNSITNSITPLAVSAEN